MNVRQRMNLRLILWMLFLIYSPAALYGITLDHAPIQDFDESVWRNPNTANAFYSRGVAHSRKGNYELARGDFDAAIQIAPTHRLALYNRGIANLKSGDYQRAITDFDQAIRIDPNVPETYYIRGRAKFYQGDFGAAVQDLEKVLQVRPRDMYRLLVLYLAHRRSGKTMDDDLTRLPSGLELHEWPGPVVSMFLSTADARAVLAAAADADALKQRERQCEAYFYIGEQLLLSGSKSEAVEMFKASLATGITNFFEYEGAKAELKRLGR